MENLNLVEILKDCPKGTPLYSPIFGDVKLENVYEDRFYSSYPIEVRTSSSDPENVIKSFNAEGKYLERYANSECLLFPSRDCRDWSQFVPPMPEPEDEQEPETGPVYRPFDRVLVRDTIFDRWDIAFFKEEFEGELYPYLVMGSVCRYKHCIPYEGNESLFNTTKTPQG